MRSIVTVTVACAIGTRLFASPPTSFAATFKEADTVVVASTSAVQPVRKSSQWRKRLKDATPLIYDCDLTIRIDAVIKSSDPYLVATSSIHIIVDSADPTCFAADAASTWNRTGPILWLLRGSNGGLRPVRDLSQSVRPLRMFSPELGRKAAQWREPELAVAYLLLKPGVLISVDHYARSPFPAQIANLVGFANFLRVYSRIYTESYDDDRGIISLAVSSFGQCLVSARRAAGERRLEASELPWLDPSWQRRTEEMQLASMSWSSKDELLEAFDSPDQAINDLTMWACGSSRRVTTRAQDLLQRFFDLPAVVLPCIPCQ